MNRSPRAMILAAGFGSRLAEVGRARPKPMLPVAGLPLVRWAVLWLRHHGVREIVVNLHHLGEQIQAELGDGSGLGVSIAYSHEQGQILGTGGGLRQARPLLDDGRRGPIVVVNGKILIDLDLGQVLAQHHDTGAEATMVVRPDADAQRWGSMELAADGRVIRLLGRSPSATAPAPTSGPLMFTGVHVINPGFLDRVPPTGEQCIIRTAYRSLFDQGQGLFGYMTDKYWWEHSTTERYLQGVFNVLDGAVPLPFAPGPLCGVAAEARVDPTARVLDPVWVGPGAVIEANATVGPHAQLGAGVRVRAGVRVERAVVWAGEVGRDVVDEVVVGADP